MVIEVIESHGILLFESKDEPPVSAHRHGIQPRQTPAQRVQAPAGRAHVLGARSVFKGGEEDPESSGVFGSDAGLRTGPEEPLQSLVPELLYHGASVACQATLVNIF